MGNTGLTLSEDALDDIDLFLDRVDELSALECNAITDLISHELERECIPHQRMCGSARQIYSGDTVFPHCWIQLADGQILDVRLRMYFPYCEDVPHGRFKPTVTHYIYTGHANPEERLDESLLISMIG
ncbi:hypothetical protein [Marinobacter salicampi]|uniref:hypothetical protein n=1 Tax=Marinobacter salicampi TaxID=435907 RepID=UPI00140E7A3C|nr:hypothetical protein [Marinobacter salicampi]